MEGSALVGHPIPILLSEEQHVFTLNEEALEQVLLQDHIKDRNAVVVSVAGAFRKGKSFILDFFLRYMNHTVRRWLAVQKLDQGSLYSSRCIRHPGSRFFRC